MDSARTPTFAARQVSFSIFHGHTKLIDGNFTIMDAPGVSCFGANREVRIEGRRERAAIFEGVVFEHQLNADASAFISFRYYVAEPAHGSPIGHRQVVQLKADLNMGSESGNEKLESVMLGGTHEFVFRSHALA